MINRYLVGTEMKNRREERDTSRPQTRAIYFSGYTPITIESWNIKKKKRMVSIIYTFCEIKKPSKNY